MIASVVLAASVVVIAGVLSASYQQTRHQERTTVAVMIGRQLMEEIASKPVRLPDNTTGSPGWPGVRNRALYDTVNDYNGYTDSTDAMPTLAGQSLNVGNGEVFTRTVRVTSGVRPTAGNHALAPAADFALVTVTVTPADGAPVELSQFVAHAMRMR